MPLKKWAAPSVRCAHGPDSRAFIGCSDDELVILSAGVRFQAASLAMEKQADKKKGRHMSSAAKWLTRHAIDLVVCAFALVTIPLWIVYGFVVGYREWKSAVHGARLTARIATLRAFRRHAS